MVKKKLYVNVFLFFHTVKYIVNFVYIFGNFFHLILNLKCPGYLW